MSDPRLLCEELILASYWPRTGMMSGVHRIIEGQGTGASCRPDGARNDFCACPAYATETESLYKNGRDPASESSVAFQLSSSRSLCSSFLFFLLLFSYRYPFFLIFLVRRTRATSHFDETSPTKPEAASWTICYLTTPFSSRQTAAHPRSLSCRRGEILSSFKVEPRPYS